MEVDRSGGKKDIDGERPVIVAWDTCTMRGVLAFGTRERLLAEEYFESVKGHTGWLMPRMDFAMKDLGLSPSDIDYVAVGIGPGTFTGVKVGVASAKAVAFGLRKPLLGMPTLDVLAAAAPPTADIVLSTIDARRGQLYAAVYKQEDRRRERVTDFACLTVDEVAHMVTAMGFRELAMVGESPAGLTNALRKSGTVVTVEDSYPSGPILHELAHEMVRAGVRSDALSVSPIYLKKPT